jgi:hypothetical protein
MEDVRHTLCWGGEDILLEGFQTSPAHPCDKSGMEVKTSEWLE